MPWPIYSERLMHHSAPGEWNWLVPEESRCVITSIAVINGSGQNAEWAVQIAGISIGYSVLAPAAREYITTRQVAYQLEVVRMFLQFTGIFCTVSGYVFKDDTGRTGPPQALRKPAVPELPPHGAPSLSSHQRGA